jgi:kinetochore protein Mis12/MTW1
VDKAATLRGLPAPGRDCALLTPQGLDFDVPADAPTTASVSLQRQKVRESQRLNRLLLRQSSENAALLGQLRSLKAQVPSGSTDDGTTGWPFGFLSQTASLADGTASAPLSTTTAFALGQLPALRSLAADVESRMRELARRNGAGLERPGSDEEKTARRRRAEYIETQTRRFLESQGLELGKPGEVRDGEWQGQGRALDTGEVEDLERVASAMAASADATRV